MAPSVTIGGEQESVENPSQEKVPEGGEEQLLAGKYKSEEELAKGTLELLKSKGQDLEQFYKSLESGADPFAQWKQAQEQEREQEQQEDNSQQQTDDSQQQQEENQNTEQQRTQVEQMLADNGLDMQTFEDEFSQNGELSDESYQKLEQIFPREMIDAYMEGQKAKAQEFTQSIMNEVGGEETYESMVQWASENLSEQEINDYNNALDSGDFNEAQKAVRALAYKYNQATQSAPKKGENLLHGNRKGPSGPAGYESKEEMVNDMKKPEYESDPAFRKYVDERIKRTTAF